MKTFQNQRVKWTYVTHLIDPTQVAAVVAPVEETNPGAVMLARVVTVSKHKELESVEGRRQALFPGDVIAGVLGHRYATDQFEAEAHCSGTSGHIVGMGGVLGRVVSMNSRMPEPTVIEWLGRVVDPDGRPLHMSRFRVLAPRSATARPTTILSLGASMNAGKTTTAAHMVGSLTRAGHRVVALKITGTACRKDPNLLYDAGAVQVLDFTHAGWPSTAGCSRDELHAIAAHLRAAAAALRPDFVIIEIADGILQRETSMLLQDDAFRRSIDGVTFAGPDAMSCDSGVRRLMQMGYTVLATSGPVANSRLGAAEVEGACGVRCLSIEALAGGALVPALEELHRRSRIQGAAVPTTGRRGRAVRPGLAARSTGTSGLRASERTAPPIAC